VGSGAEATLSSVKICAIHRRFLITIVTKDIDANEKVECFMVNKRTKVFKKSEIFMSFAEKNGNSRG
jgi:hypothetical protein